MPNKKRKRSDYALVLSDEQASAFLKLAQNRDEPFEQVISRALDQYIETEKRTWQPKQ